jgi:hypothetical protein
MDYDWLLRGIFASTVVHVPYQVTIIADGGISVNNPQTVSEIVMALRKNGYLRTPLAEAMLRGYFHARSWLRRTLTLLGIYPLLLSVRRGC